MKNYIYALILLFLFHNASYAEENFISIVHYSIYKGMKASQESILFHLDDNKYEPNINGSKKCQNFIDYLSKDGKQAYIDSYILAHYLYKREKEKVLPKKVLGVMLVCEKTTGKDMDCLEDLKKELIRDGFTNELAESGTELLSLLGKCDNSELIGKPILIDTRNLGSGDFID